MTIQRNRLCALLGVVLSLAAGAGCSGPTVLPPTPNRTPTDPAAVEIFQQQPAKYEKLGVVETTQNIRFGEGADVSPVVNDLKARAAAMGANGLLLIVDGTGAGTPQSLLATGMYNGEPYQIPVATEPTRRAMATAIYVLKK